MKLVSVETPEKSVCKMTFSATAEELEAASNAVYERTRASYTIKGFAKGEADRAQIEADRPLQSYSSTKHRVRSSSVSRRRISLGVPSLVMSTSAARGRWL